MLAVSEAHRGKGLASALVRMAIESLTAAGAEEIVLETEETNIASLKLYEKLGFLRMKHLQRYYLNGNSAYRLMLLVHPPEGATQLGRARYSGIRPLNEFEQHRVETLDDLGIGKQRREDQEW